MRKTIRVLFLLAVVWILAGVAIFISRSMKTTPESLQAYLTRNDLTAASPAERSKVIASAADQLNRLNFDERQQLRDSGSVRKFFDQMSQDEKKHFLELTMPEGFRQLMLALNKMDPDKRKKIVQRALDDIDKRNPKDAPHLDETEAKKIVEQGLSTFYEEASVDVKLDFAPVIERLQKSTQGLH